jgi:tetratricopeptide (TPR) repeat protein
MPKRPVRDVRHSAYTDHEIRKPGPRTTGAAGPRTLRPFGAMKAGDREYGLAYATVPGFEKQARAYLDRSGATDPDVLTYRAYLYESSGELPAAMRLYEEALKSDSAQVGAAVNLGNLYAKRNDERKAIPLWRHALELSPGLASVQLSLAVAEYRTGDIPGAERDLEKLLQLNPGATSARRLLEQLRARR